MLLSISLTGLLAAAATAKVVMVQVGNPTAPQPADKLKFLPDVVMADPGDTVRFMFMGNHSVTQQDNFNKCAPGAPSGTTPFDSGIKARGETFDLPPAAMKPGVVINYYCKIKQGAHCKAPNFMQGTVVISGGAGGAQAGIAAAGAAQAGAAQTGAARAGAAGAGATAPATITVIVGKDGMNMYSPANIEASAGDSVMFMWTGGQKMHNVVPSDKPQSCERSPKADTDPILKALASGAPQQSGQHVFKIPATVKPGDMMYYFCSVGTHCSADKMYGMIKIVPPGTARNAVAAPTAGAAGAAGATGARGGAGATGTTGAGADTTADAGTTAEPAAAGTTKSGASGMAATALAVVLPAAAALLRLA